MKFVGAAPDLTLRPLSENDYLLWRESFARRRPARDFHDEGPVPLDELTADHFSQCLRRYEAWAGEDKVYVLGAFCGRSRALVGLADLSTLARDGRDWANLGFRVHNQHHGQGFGRVLIRAAVRHGFTALRYHRIEAAVRLDNVPAIRATEAAGLERECVRRKFWRDPDGCADHAIYVAIADSE